MQQQNSSKYDQYEIVWPNGLGNTISSEIEAFLKSEEACDENGGLSKKMMHRSQYFLSQSGSRVLTG